ncbi:hypothetical protein AX16_006973 [Volvariella volvacea WC 439]|nr:hypothetical protein AX16_006973 [Volvariella volvacea WC 439]
MAIEPLAAQNGRASELSSAPQLHTAANGHAVNGTGPLDAASERLQIIDDEKNFTRGMNAQVERWGLIDAGFDYNIVAVIGSQSTGKSTLLNGLFGTTFDVMDESKRQQTTKGIWMCRGKGTNIMIMDVEGTDGRERGENQDFERKSALFSLASSEILMINLWEHQVGLYQGANMGLLKTVFEVNLGLFGRRSQDGLSGRTLLFFVIRDHIGNTPLSNLQNTLTQDLYRMWDSITKPAELQDAQLSDYFDLGFTSLPHKHLLPDQFNQQVKQLRQRFVDKNREDYLFKSVYHKRIPADGVAFYMEGIWEQVQSNKDLDLPTQQELLAQFRCDEISAVALNEFTEQAKSQKRPVESGNVVPGLGAMMAEWRGGALQRYDRDASRYHKGVYQRKRADLLAAVDAILSPLFLGQIKNLHKQCLTAFKKALQDGLKGENYNYVDVLAKAQAELEKAFTSVAAEAKIEGAAWEWEDDFALLKEEARSVADQFRKDETKKMINAIERTFKKQIVEPVELALRKASSDMWDSVLQAFREVLEKAEKTYSSKAESLNCMEGEKEASLATLRKKAWLALRAKIDEQTGETSLLAKLRGHFEERFRYDENGTPRVWQPEDDIDGAFIKAKDQTLGLVPLYSKISPVDSSLSFTLPSESSSNPLDPEDEFDFESTLTVLSATKSDDLKAKFRKEADAYFVEAKRSTVSSVAQIPYWMYGVLVVLGWNEAMLVLSSPLYFTFMLISVVSAYVILQLGLAGPLYQVLKTVVAEIQRQIAVKLREQFAEPATAQPYRIRPAHNSTRTYGDEDSDVTLRDELQSKQM